MTLGPTGCMGWAEASPRKGKGHPGPTTRDPATVRGRPAAKQTGQNSLGVIYTQAGRGPAAGDPGRRCRPLAGYCGFAHERRVGPATRTRGESQGHGALFSVTSGSTCLPSAAGAEKRRVLAEGKILAFRVSDARGEEQGGGLILVCKANSSFLGREGGQAAQPSPAASLAF